MQGLCCFEFDRDIWIVKDHRSGKPFAMHLSWQFSQAIDVVSAFLNLRREIRITGDHDWQFAVNRMVSGDWITNDRADQITMLSYMFIDLGRWKIDG